MEDITGGRRKKVTREIALDIRKDYQSGMKWLSLKEKYSIGICTLHKILNGTHVSIREME